VLSVTENLGDPHYQRRGTVMRLAGQAGFRLRNEHRGFGNYTLNLEKT
jgi:hypothetical protein